MTIKVAIIQRPPPPLPREQIIERIAHEIADAARVGCRLVVFPESYVPGYPAWVWRLQPGPDMRFCGELHAALLANAVDLAAAQLDPVRDAARSHEVTVVLGMHEREQRFSRAELFNSVVTIGPDGSILNVHRKLMPTHPERMVWSQGDARGLRVVATPVGRIGSLICWENYMPLARYALYMQAMDILIAPTWDYGDEWIASMQHIAKEGGCWVIGAGTAMQGSDLPLSIHDRARVAPEDEWLCDGDSVVVRPFGRIAAGPLRRDKGMLIAQIELESAARAKRLLDVAGHYARSDLFRFDVDRSLRVPISFRDA